MIKIQKLLKGLGLFPYSLDGQNGPLTIRAVKNFQRLHPPLGIDGIAGKRTLEQLIIAPIPNRDNYSQTALIKKFGLPGNNLVKAIMPYIMKIAWNERLKIDKFSCNKSVRDVIEKVFLAIYDHYGLEEIQKLGLDLFGGCYNNRAIRGGTKLSTHSWAISIDLDPIHNQFKWDRQKARFNDIEYDPFWAILEHYKVTAFGKKYNFDFMHLQFDNVE